MGPVVEKVESFVPNKGSCRADLSCDQSSLAVGCYRSGLALAYTNPTCSGPTELTSVVPSWCLVVGCK